MAHGAGRQWQLGPDPGRALRRRDDAEELQRALAQLRPELRDVVLQHVYGECTFQEIAERNEVPLGTTLWRMRRAKEELRRLFSERSAAEPAP